MLTFGCGKSIRTSLGIAGHQIVLGTIARIQYRKGIDILLDTARQLIPRYKNVVFLVVGGSVPGQEDYAETLTRAAEDPVFNGQIKFLGVRQDIPDLLASLDIFVFPTRAEPFGVAVIEAMAAALPVVASRVGGIPEIITSSDLGFLVSPISAAAFARTIEGVIKMADRGKTTGERARQSVLERFDGRLVARRLEACYLQLVPPDRR
jgi:glycosyltransferase involved in cell wall biosynthesis